MRPSPTTEPAPSPPLQATPRAPLALLHVGFVLTGVVTTLLGPLLPILARRWTLDDWQAGLLFTLQFAGSLLGVAASSAGMTRLGFRATIAMGLGFMAVGVTPLASDTAMPGFAGVFCFGVGLGLTIPTTNMTVAAWQPSRRASALNVLNLAWGVGAVAAPPVVAHFHRIGQIRLFPIALAAALAGIALALAWLRLPGTGETSDADSDRRDAGPPWWTPEVLLFGGLLFIYVGTETAVAGWVAVYAERLAIVTPAVALAAPSIFWAALLVGRGVAPVLLRRVTDARLVSSSLIVATGGIGLLLAAGSAMSLVMAVAAGGLGLAAVFPTTVALFSRRFDREAARLAAPVFALASLGGACLPPLVGAVSSYAGSLTIGLIVPLVGCLAMLAISSRLPAAGFQREGGIIAPA